MSILTISGSLRGDSVNRKLLAEAATLYGGEVVEADLNLPLYNGDLEAAEGLPAKVKTLADQVLNAEAILISTPEYNKAPSGVLKNALDWLSRDSRKVLSGKPVAVMSAAAGRTGGRPHNMCCATSWRRCAPMSWPGQRSAWPLQARNLKQAGWKTNAT